MTIHYTYELSSGSWQTIAATDSIEDALNVCDGTRYRLFVSVADLPVALKGIRNFKGLTQSQLADLIGGYSKQTISLIESGSRPIGLNLLADFGKAFGIEFGVSIQLL